MMLANDAALLICEALRGAQGSQSMVYYFGLGHGFADSAGANGAVMKQAKGWREPYGPAMRRIPGVNAAGGTPICEALVHGIRELSKVQAGRKVLLVLTDGEGLPSKETMELCAEARKRGIAIVGVGIAASVGRHFKHSTSVHKLGDLAAKTMRTLIDAVKREFPGA